MGKSFPKRDFVIHVICLRKQIYYHIFKVQSLFSCWINTANEYKYEITRDNTSA